jgi:hypothetical protein
VFRKQTFSSALKKRSSLPQLWRGIGSWSDVINRKFISFKMSQLRKQLTQIFCEKFKTKHLSVTAGTYEKGECPYFSIASLKTVRM